MEFYKASLIYLVLRLSNDVPFEILANADENDYTDLLADYLGIYNEDELRDYIEEML